MSFSRKRYSTLTTEDNMPFEKLTDTSPMPFGKYEGTPMVDVPADCLHYLWHDGLYRKTKDTTDSPQKQVALYIKKSMSALKEEFKDGRWRKPE
jgi:hypothetical protein